MSNTSAKPISSVIGTEAISVKAATMARARTGQPSLWPNQPITAMPQSMIDTAVLNTT